jgi:DNA-cytosine methyltransferase
MQIIDLFSGVGGFSIAGHKLGWETILFCEKEQFPQQVLRERFPNVPIFDDVCKLTGETIDGLIQSDRPIIVTGGFPCQPFSVAGAREGTEDDRHLWPEMFRIIKAVRPDYVIGENVPGLLSIEGGMVFEQVCLDLESEGYEVQAFVLPACATGAPHRRDRVWIVASNPESGRRGRLRNESEATRTRKGNQLPGSELAVSLTPDTNEIGINRCGPSGSNEGQQPTDSEQSGSGWASETGGYAGERITPDANVLRGLQKHELQQPKILEQSCEGGTTPNTQQIGYGGRSNTNGIGTERQVHQDFGHDRNGVWSEIEGCDRVNSNTNESGLRRESNTQQQPAGATGNYWHDWPSISPFHSGHDGLSPELVRHIRTSLSEAGETPENIEAYIRKESNWLRKQAIMAAGNAIVPQVVLQIMKAIENHYNTINHEQKN